MNNDIEQRYSNSQLAIRHPFTFEYPVENLSIDCRRMSVIGRLATAVVGWFVFVDDRRQDIDPMSTFDRRILHRAIRLVKTT